MSDTDIGRQPSGRDGPSTSFAGQVDASWLDINCHMNVSWFDRVFDAGEKTFFEEFGVDDTFITLTGLSFFRLERFVRYERELLAGDRVEVRSIVVWTDFRRVHHFHELWNIDALYRAAYVDVLSIQVDVKQRRSVQISHPDILGPLQALSEQHERWGRPKGVLPRRSGWFVPS
ncbi:thioesterase family protein [Corticibacterium sp. UT-5YL-CI-8]|nr:thioesterase family protein [Tianweitania sp. UT-5YL-CI-8]